MRVLDKKTTKEMFQLATTTITKVWKIEKERKETPFIWWLYFYLSRSIRNEMTLFNDTFFFVSLPSSSSSLSFLIQFIRKLEKRREEKNSFSPSHLSAKHILYTFLIDRKAICLLVYSSSSSFFASLFV